MPSLNFKPQFADMVVSGQKFQSIRKVGGIPWKVGDKAHLFTGLRTKGCRKLGAGIVIHIYKFEIKDGRPWLNGDPSPSTETSNGSARDDGFKSWSEMRDFFEETHGLPFTGILIKWELI